MTICRQPEASRRSSMKRVRTAKSAVLRSLGAEEPYPDPRRSANGQTILLCHPGSPSRQLSAAVSTIKVSGAPEELTLLWIS